MRRNPLPCARAGAAVKLIRGAVARGKPGGGDLDRDTELAIVRRAYAKQILAAAGVADERIEAALATVRREAFLGPGPWKVLRSLPAGYVPTPSDNPVYLYVDQVVGILPERDLNNGLPSLHAAMIASASPKVGEHVVHIGVGGGYYTAILTELVGASGEVTAIEVDADLAARAAANLSAVRNVRVLQGNGVNMQFNPADVIYVNAGASRPIDAWLDRLNEGGRLILPLTTDRQSGIAFRFERRGTDFLARGIAPVGFFPCEGARDAESEAALAAALKNDRWREITRLYRDINPPAEGCWLRAPGWYLA